ncbi:MAG: phosphoribosylanthranilate isomerase [Candidatus Hadarchaeum sp.]|uniref:phosphoribosylanthranilate isomerase n=1 Tax=Candidatus Hadarchaeum sp. TaxID=2883567 RepID=UPI003D12651E
MIKIKICGFTRVVDVKAACELGVDMVGVILIPESSRHVAVDQARKIFREVEPSISKVAVFMPRSLGDVKEICRKLRPDCLQFHLTFPIEELLEKREELDAQIMIVVPVPQKADNPEGIINRVLEVSEAADFLLIDTKGETGGGTGLTHDWNLSARIRSVVDKPVFLAGGLNSRNVVQAIKLVRPHGVDVASGVESSPGRKDPKLMREFVEAVRNARQYP